MAKKKDDSAVEVPTVQKKMKETMQLDGDDCIDGMDVGDEVVLQVKVRCISKGIDTWDKNEKSTQRYEILGVSKADKGAAFAAKAQRAMKGVAE
jgi:hypothetical protein